MLTVHHLGLSQSERIVWLCEELDLEYAFERYERRADKSAPEAYKALHPMGIAPVITDGAVTLAESGAICDYIVARYGQGRLIPSADDPDFADHLFWFHWSNATFMTTRMMQFMVARAGADPWSGIAGDRARLCWQLIEDRLGHTPYFGGRQLTTADIMMVFPLTTLSAVFESEAPGPNLTAYLEQIRARAAYARAMAKAEPGALMDGWPPLGAPAE